jgi:hypothetical protein
MMVDPKKLRHHPWYRGPGAPARRRIASERLWRELQSVQPEIEEIVSGESIDDILRGICRMVPGILADNRRSQVKNGNGECELTVGERPELIVDGHAGDVTIRGWDASTIRVQTDDDDAFVNVKQQGDRVRIGGDWPGHGPGSDYEIDVPRGCAITVDSVQGDVEIEGTRAGATVESASGDVTLTDVSGASRVKTASGEITLARISGNLTVETASGDVEVDESSLSAFNISTVSGDAEVETGLRQDGSYRFKTTSGDLTLKVPRDTRATVQMHTRSGDVHCDLPFNVTRHDRRRWEGKLNGGGVTVEMSSMSGDLEIEEGRRGTVPSGPYTPSVPVSPMPPMEPFDAMDRFDPFQGDVPQPASASDVPAAPSPDSSAILEALARGEIGVDEAMAELERLGA